MNTYLIPLSNVDELLKKINRIKNKGANVTFRMGQEKSVLVTIDVPVANSNMTTRRTISITCVEIEVDGKYEIHGWQFVGSIEHSEVGNIVRCIDSDLSGKVPPMYRTTGPSCEHCNRIRDRKDTYLIYNKKTDEFKQVGKTCLMDFTGGMDAEVCAQMAQTVKLADEGESNGLNDMFFNSQSNAGLLTKEVKPVAYGYVKQHGYTPKQTGHIIAKYLFGISEGLHITPASDKEIEDMNEWVNNRKSDSDYMANAKVAWFKESCEYRDMALVSSLVSIYLKEKEMELKMSQSGCNEFSGVIGKTVVISKPQSIRVIFIKSGQQYSRHAPDVYVYSIVGDDGRTYVWSTSTFGLQNNVDSIESIVGVVKGHDIYKGTKQTVITRGKVAYKEAKRQEVNKAKQELSSFFEAIDN